MSNLVPGLGPQGRQTPIEIALQIDAQGHTTSKALYLFLELNPSNYAKWVKTNITDNAYAEEEVDYWVFVPQEENLQGGRPTVNYKLTASFAKKLAMGSNSPKGEDAKTYFVQVEENAKKFANAVPDQLEVAALMIQELKSQRDRLNEVEGAVNNIQGTVQAVKDVFAPEEENWREMIRKNIDKIVEIANSDHQTIYNESYEMLDKQGFDINKRLKNWRNRMLKQGATKTQIKKVSKLDVIESDPKAKGLYTGIVRGMVVRYVV